MEGLQGYALGEEIYRGARTTVYRACCNEDKHPVILKVLRKEKASAQAVSHLRREYEINRAAMRVEGVVAVERLLIGSHFTALVLEDFGGEPLNLLLPLRVDFFLEVAMQLAEILGKLHLAGIVHRDIKPANIIVHRDSGQVRLADFGVALAPGYGRESRALSGTPAFMAPEQTGRLNREMDYRVDFYSLGVTLYQALVGELPFTCTDSLQLAHAHVAKVPVAPHIRKHELPRPLSCIIMKLLAKAPEDRYQSGAGLKADLKLLQQYRLDDGEIANFSLGNWDIPAQFQISSKIYGRGRELDQLMAAFTRASQGEVEFVFLSGSAGVGKSSLIREMFTRLSGDAYLLSGKFDQLDNPPFGAVIQCFDELMRQLASESEEQLASWRDMLVQALGATRRLIAQLIPSMNFILDAPKTSPPLPDTERQKLLDIAFAGLLKIFVRSEHPLVLFFDDLQWADPASMRWLHTIASDRSLGHLVVIGAYRESEIKGNGALLAALKQIRAKAKFIALQQFSENSLEEMLADTFYREKSEVLSLAKLVQLKTQGNPFFVKQFLVTLQRLDAFEYLPQRGWNWNIDKIRQMDITDNVVELIQQKGRELSKNSREVLSLAACLGNKFCYSLLKNVARKCLDAKTSIDKALRQAINEGMLLTSLAATTGESDYRFAHDQIQKSFYAIVGENRKLSWHAAIGKILWGNKAVEKLEKEIYTIAYHLNFATSLLKTSEERLQLARLNFLAGEKARGETAHVAATDYFEKGLRLLPKNAWQRHYRLAFSLYRAKAECEHLQGNFLKAESFFELLLEYAKTKLEKAELYESKVLLYTSAGKTKLAIKNGIAALRLLGIRIPENKWQVKVIALLEIARAWLIIRRKEADTFLELPEINATEKKAVIRIIGNTVVPAFMGNPDMFVLLCSKIICFANRYGNCEFSPFAYCGFSIIIGPIFNDYEKSRKFSIMALQLDEKYHCARFKAQLYYTFGEFINHHYQSHLRTSLPYLEKAYHYGLECGDLTWAGYACVDIVLTSLTAGLPLAEVIRRGRSYLNFVELTKDPVSCNAFHTSLQAVLAYRGKTKAPWLLSDENIDEERLARDISAGDNLTIRALYFSIKMELCLVFHRAKQALQFAIAAEKIADAMKGELCYTQYVFYHALTLTAVFPKAKARKRVKYLRQLKRFQKKMKIWADNAPVNFLHKLLLIEAEIARIRGKCNRAEQLYERAIDKAHENDYINDAAFACELAAEFYLDRGISRIARTYLHESYQCYQRWGAMPKIEALATKYLDLFGKREKAKGTFLEDKSLTRSFSTVECDPAFLDFSTILKACRIIAGEVDLPLLLDKFMLLVMESAGAQKALFIIAKEGQLKVVAQKSVDNQEDFLPPIDIDLRLDLSPAIIRYVDRTLECVVIDDAVHHEKFASCPYVQTRSPKSILCMPILEQGRMLGIVYLENNLATYAFNEKRVEILHILAAQAAIAMENADLYHKMNLLNEGLKREVNERQKAIEALRENQERLNLVLRQVPALLWTTDRELRFTSTSGQAMQIFDLQPGELTGIALSDYLENDKPDFLPLASHRQALGGKSAKIEYKLQGHFFEACVEPLWSNEHEIIGTVGVALDITERRELERKVLDIGEREQRRIARDLHDGLGQYLLGIGWGARRTESKLKKLGLEQEAKKAAELAEMADQALEQTQRMIKNLFPVELEHQGLHAALQQLGRNLKNTCRVVCHFKGEENFAAASPSATAHLFRIAQEATNNAIKHGKAKNITIDLICDNGASLLRIQDNGRGITDHVVGSGLGLKSMKYRANLLGATFCIQRNKGGGTLVECRFAISDLSK